MKHAQPSLIWVHAALDDYGLSVWAFRVYARIARRAGPGGECYESAANMAEACDMSRRQLYRAIDELLQANLIRKQSRAASNQTTIYSLMPIEEEAGVVPHRHRGRASQAHRSTSHEVHTETNVSVSPEPKKVEPRGKGKGFGPVIGAAMEAWEDKRHPSWPSLARMTSRGAKYVKEFWDYYDKDTEKACEMMQLAIAWAVEQEDWWRQSKSPPSFDEMAANNKLEGYAEKAAHAQKEEGPKDQPDPWLGKTVPHKLGYLVILKEVDVPGYRYWGEFIGDEFGASDPPEPMWVYAHDLEAAS